MHNGVVVRRHINPLVRFVQFYTLPNQGEGFPLVPLIICAVTPSFWHHLFSRLWWMEGWMAFPLYQFVALGLLLPGSKLQASASLSAPFLLRLRTCDARHRSSQLTRMHAISNSVFFWILIWKFWLVWCEIFYRLVLQKKTL